MREARAAGASGLARFSKSSKSETALVSTRLSVFPAKPIIRAIIPAREISTAKPASLSCKQITLRGLGGGCARREII